MQNKPLLYLWFDYKQEVIFGLVLSAVTILSYWLGTFMPEDVFENYINPVEYIGTATVCFFGAAVLFSQKDQHAIRRSWACVLLIWGLIDVFLYVLRYWFHITAIGGTPADPLYNASVIVGNILAWLLFIYPSQVLHPGWLNWRRAVLLVLPMIVLGVVDYFLSMNMLHIIMLYPMIIFLLLCRHVSKYRKWCEDNFSSMDDIDVQWIVRYLTMLAIAGIAFYFIVFCYLPNRMFTQNWTLLLILAYTTVSLTYRPDPWSQVQKAEMPCAPEEQNDSVQSKSEEQEDPALKTSLEEWLSKEKPYLNPDFQLMDLRAVLPINRTYLSRFINTAYGCSFYQWVNHLRIEEAKRLMREQPDMKMKDIAERCGFASRQTFTRAFARETGMTPCEWGEKA